MGGASCQTDLSQMNRRDFFTALAFGFLTLFVRRSTQARVLGPHLEGKTIPRGLYISQCVGRGKPMYPQREIPILHQKSVVEGEFEGLREMLKGPIGPTYPNNSLDNPPNP